VGQNGYHNPKLPKFEFPKFDGTSPKYWLGQCKDYFELYGTEPHMWVRVAKMHFVDAAKRWAPSVENQLQSCSWATFVSLILNRFGQDQHEILIRQLFQIHQTGSVDEFIEQYSAVVDQLSAYGGTTDPLYYTLRFIDGLKDYIRAPVALHRPQNLDTACVLAKLQEQMADAGKKKEFRRWEPNAAKPYFTKALPLPLPPPHRQERPARSWFISQWNMLVGHLLMSVGRLFVLNGVLRDCVCVVLASGRVIISARHKFSSMLCKK
jgi:hypothetical protein